MHVYGGFEVPSLCCLVPSFSQLAEANQTVEQLKVSLAALEEQTAKDHTLISSLRKSTAHAERRADDSEAEMLRLKARTTEAEAELGSVSVCLSACMIAHANILFT